MLYIQENLRMHTFIGIGKCTAQCTLFTMYIDPYIHTVHSFRVRIFLFSSFSQWARGPRSVNEEEKVSLKRDRETTEPNVLLWYTAPQCTENLIYMAWPGVYTVQVIYISPPNLGSRNRHCLHSIWEHNLRISGRGNQFLCVSILYWVLKYAKVITEGPDIHNIW
jgi:hypothetical protein